MTCNHSTHTHTQCDMSKQENSKIILRIVDNYRRREGTRNKRRDGGAKVQKNVDGQVTAWINFPSLAKKPVWIEA